MQDTVIINLQEWYREILTELIEIAKTLSSKYTRSKIRKAMPEEFAYIIDELLHVQNKDIESKSELVETEKERLMVKHTDNGKKILEDIEGLKKLLYAYRDGAIEQGNA